MKILLDTNVWRYIVDHNALGAVRQAVGRSRHDIVVAPSVVYEALRTSDRELRKAIVAAMTLSCWKRLMPDAYWESHEIRFEIGRLHPEWLNSSGDLAYQRMLRHDWSRSRGGFWDRARNDTHQESRRIDASGSMETSRDAARKARAHGLTMSATWRDTAFDAIKIAPIEAMPGWNGEPVDFWRLDAKENFARAMSLASHPYFDWLAGEVNLPMLMHQTGDLTRFWFHEVVAKHMPRHWLRSAFEFQQQFHKVTDGTPCDAQLGTYLVDVDVMLSADKNMVRFAERCRSEAPFALARSQLIPGGQTAIDALLDALSRPNKPTRKPSALAVPTVK